MTPRRMGRPGLLGMAARTAVVAGTATAVSGNVQRRQQSRAQDAQAQDAQAQADAEAQAQQAEYAAPPPPAAPAAPPESALLDQLNQLSQLHNAGVLSDSEFTAAKAKLLA